MGSEDREEMTVRLSIEEERQSSSTYSGMSGRRRSMMALYTVSCRMGRVYQSDYHR
jgi:hypothetical protein